MHNSKLIRYLSHLDHLQLQRFRDFVDSPYFNKHENTKALLAYILEADSWETASLQKRRAFAAIFPNRAYQSQLLSNLISYLLRLFRQFLAQEHFSTQEAEQTLALLEQASTNGQVKLFELAANRWERQQASYPLQDGAYHFAAFRYQQVRNDFDLRQGSRFDGHRLAQADAHFDYYLISEKLRLACEMLARSQVTGQTYELPLTHHLLPFLEARKAHFKTIPAVWVYLLIFRMIRDDQARDYFELKERLQQDAQYFSTSEGRDLYTYSLNYCIRRLNYGESAFRRETFELYQQMLSTGLLHRSGILPAWDYTNIVSLGCDLQEYKWTYRFIEEQKDKLPNNERQNTYTYNLAVYEYQQQHYDKAIQLLHQVEFTEVYYNLLVRILRLKIYFEQGDQEALLYLLDTFRIYLLRNRQIADNRRRSALNLLRYTKKLARLTEDAQLISSRPFHQALRRFEEQIQDHQRLTNKAWLLTQVRRLREEFPES